MTGVSRAAQTAEAPLENVRDRRRTGCGRAVHATCICATCSRPGPERRARSGRAGRASPSSKPSRDWIVPPARRARTSRPAIAGRCGGCPQFGTVTLPAECPSGRAATRRRSAPWMLGRARRGLLEIRELGMEPQCLDLVTRNRPGCPSIALPGGRKPGPRVQGINHLFQLIFAGLLRA